MYPYITPEPHRLFQLFLEDKFANLTPVETFLSSGNHTKALQSPFVWGSKLENFGLWMIEALFPMATSCSFL